MSIRISGGKFKSRIIKGPNGVYSRPLLGVIKEATFSILGAKVEESTIVDCFSGTGSFGLEALSRGAKFVVFIEKSAKLVSILRQNVKDLGMDKCSYIIEDDIVKSLPCLLASCFADIIFLDPPFFSVDGKKVLECLLRNYTSFKHLIVRFHKKEEWPYLTLANQKEKNIHTIDKRIYGDSKLIFLEPMEGLNEWNDKA